MTSLKPSLLITGATGFIGGSLVKYFNDTQEYDVVATGRSQFFKSKAIAYESVDLTQEEQLSKLDIKPKFIVHAAGLAAPWGSRKDFHAHNVIATNNLLAYALKKEVSRFIYISSSSVYSAMRHQFDVREDGVPEKVVGNYGHSKRQAEMCVLEAARNGLPSIILRPRAVIGAGDTTVLPRIIQAHKQGRLRKIGGDDILSDITTITNLTDAVRLALSSRCSITGEAFNITDGEPVSLWKMVDALMQQLNLGPLRAGLSWPMALTVSSLSEFASLIIKREPALPRYVVSLLGRSLTLNIDKARGILNYRPVQTTDEGVSEYIRYYRNQKL